MPNSWGTFHMVFSVAIVNCQRFTLSHSSDQSVICKHISAPVAFCLSVIVASFCALMAPAAIAQEETKSNAFRLAGYLPDYRMADFDLDSVRQLTDLIVFSAEPSIDSGLDLRRLKNVPWQKLQKLSSEHQIRLILSVGGWDRSSHFPVIASTPANRERFAKAALTLCLERKLAGIDIDWEHPKDASEQMAYAELLATIHETFATHGLRLSVTMAAWQEIPVEAFQYVDWVQIMAYDHDGKHSTLENAKSDVERVVKAGAPINKIVLGLPFYGRSIKDRDRAKSYSELVASQRLTPALDEVDEYYFNGPATIQKKTEYAITSKLAGVMVWEIGQDAPGDLSLLRVLRRSIDAGAVDSHKR